MSSQVDSQYIIDLIQKSKNVEFEANRLNHSEFNMLRDKLKKNKIKLIVLSEEKLF